MLVFVCVNGWMDVLVISKHFLCGKVFRNQIEKPFLGTGMDEYPGSITLIFGVQILLIYGC